MLWYNQLLSNQINDAAFYKKCAMELVEERRKTDIKILISALEVENENISLTISNILYEVSLIDPSLLEEDVDLFIKTCLGEKRLIHNNSLRILIILAPSKHKIIFQKLDVISDLFINGDDDVKESFVTLLIVLAKLSQDYFKEICNALNVILEFYPAETFVTCAKKVLPVVNKDNFECFQKIIVKRRDDLQIIDQQEIDRILSHILLKMSGKN